MSIASAERSDVASRDRVSAELGEWVAEHWDAQMSLAEWRRLLMEAGWAVPSWPRRWYGRGLPGWTDELVAHRLAELGVVGGPIGSAITLAAPTILEHGPDPLRGRFLGPIVSGAQTWCQLFSEPGAGSDLAGLTTTAVLDGDEWIVNGQKLWTTSAHHCDYGMLLARTNWDVPKHQGLTYFAIPMRQAGVLVRPLRQMNHHTSFNEVFLTDARVPREFVIGEVGKGWDVARTTLSYERRARAVSAVPPVEIPSRALDEARAEAAEWEESHKWYPQRMGRLDLLIARARDAGQDRNPVVRQSIVRAFTWQSVTEWTQARALAARAQGRAPGPEGSLGKLARSHVARAGATAHSLIAGAHGTLRGADGPLAGTIEEILTSVPAQSIAGGTDEIQRNIIGEKVLGLPREPFSDAGVAFRDALRNQ